jgi:hypothetical protein
MWVNYYYFFFLKKKKERKKEDIFGILTTKKRSVKFKQENFWDTHLAKIKNSKL